MLKKAKEIEKILGKFDFILDSREEYKPGFKFNEWELKGVPLRIEIGPKDVEKNEVVLVRRDNGKKETIKIKDLDKKVLEVLEDIQTNLFKKAEKLLKDNILEVGTLQELKKAINDKKIGFVPLCNNKEIEDSLKFESGGAKVLNIPYDQPSGLQKAKCIISGKKADYFAYVGKSY